MAKLAADDPRTIGGYRLLSRLGAGGMGRVYLARSDRGRTVAVKLVQEGLAQQQEFRARFRQEVQAALQVGGEWTAPVLDADTEAAIPWVATGYIAGPSLEQVVAHEYGPLPERSVVLLAAGLTRALRSIHAAGLIHRDMKPSNVLLTIDRPHVIDFGISRALEAAGNDGLTRTGSVLGSPAFMAPEQVMGRQLSGATDVFCLGAVLAYAATGRQPFGSTDLEAHALLYRIAHEEPDLAELPQGLHQLVVACLAKAPDSRPTLEQLLASLPDTDGQGGLDVGGEPWLPGALIAKLGRHAVQLLDTENPDTGGIPTVNRADAAAATGSAAMGSGAMDSGAVGSGAMGSGAVGSGTPPSGAQPPGTAVDPYADVHGAHTAFAPDAPAGTGTPPHGPYGAPGPPGPYGAQGGYGPQGDYGPQGGPGGYGRSGGYAQSGGYSGPYTVQGGYGPDSPQAQGSSGPSGDHGRGRGAPARRGGVATKVVAVALALVLVGGGALLAVKLFAPGGGGGEGVRGGDVPAHYVGTWQLQSGPPGQTVRLKIKQGKKGDKVATVDYKGQGWHCEFAAKLMNPEEPIRLGPSQVVSESSTQACKPGPPSNLKLTGDVLHRRYPPNLHRPVENFRRS